MSRIRPGALQASSEWIFAAALFAAGLLLSAPAHAADTIEVVLDKAKVLQLPPNTSTVIVGNPIIADVTMLRRTNQMVLTGKGYGETNMIALDSEGNAIGESIVKVFGINHGLIVQRGMSRETYACNPRCQPTSNLGDDPAFAGQVSGQIKERAGSAMSK